MKITDISQPLRDGIPAWPGDAEFSFEESARIGEGGSVVNVGKFSLSCHTGTHADAPFHFDVEGERIDDIDLSIYVGPARVISVAGAASVGEGELREHPLDGVSRLLIRTDSWPDRGSFPGSINHLRPDAAAYLAAKGVRLVGVDVPSVDPIESKELPAHHALHARGIHILEGLVLEGVSPGVYELIALPLSLAGADASPVRAALRSVE